MEAAAVPGQALMPTERPFDGSRVRRPRNERAEVFSHHKGRGGSAADTLRRASSRKRHVGENDLSCARCHGRIERGAEYFKVSHFGHGEPAGWAGVYDIDCYIRLYRELS